MDTGRTKEKAAASPRARTRGLETGAALTEAAKAKLDGKRQKQGRAEGKGNAEREEKRKRKTEKGKEEGQRREEKEEGE